MKGVLRNGYRGFGTNRVDVEKDIYKLKQERQRGREKSVGNYDVD